jgi:hypothetical protein
MATASITYTFASGALASAAEVNTNFSDIVAFLNGQVIHKDGSVAFTGGPTWSANPSSNNHLARKLYVDGKAGGVVALSVGTDGVLAASAASSQFYNWTGSTLGAQNLIAGRWYELFGFLPNVFAATSMNLPYTVSLGLFDGSTRIQTVDTLQTVASTGDGLTVCHRWLQSTSESKTYSMRVAQYSGTTTSISFSAGGGSAKTAWISLTDLGTGA